VQKAIQKIIKGLISAAVSAIPWVGGALAKLIQKIPDDKIPVPCCCGDFTYDSAPTFMNVKDNPFDFLGTFTIPGIDYAPTQSTQKLLEPKLTTEVVPRWQEAQKQQAAMIKTGTVSGADKFMEAYKIMRTGLANANALALASNFQSEFNKRYPVMSAHVESMSDAEKRMAGSWRAVMDAWMKALNVAGRNFDEEQQVRTLLANIILKSYDDTVYDLGQTHVLQVVGALAAQGNAITDRTLMELNGQVEMALTQMMAEVEYEATARHNVTEIGKEAAACDMSGCPSYSFGF
ncbi:MAG: hypothetical protein IJU98_01940, partial [Synergistaceae bacterium]|nr:hypothetical protein [Synergistaceae bacterium]